MKHVTAQTARFEALPTTAGSRSSSTSPSPSSASQTSSTERFRCLANYSCISLVRRKTDQKMVELLSDAPQEHNDVLIPEDTSSDAKACRQ